MLDRPTLDHASDVPLYRQLHQHMRQMISAGKLRDGERLPATRELAGLLGLNRTTVAAAWKLLEAEGWIRAEVGRGSFVGTTAKTQPEPRHWDQILGRGTAAPPPQEARISFSTSRPAQDLFPIGEFRRACREVIDSPEAAGLLQLGSPLGYPPLRRHLLDQARRDGTARASDDILITSGCQQALDLVARLLAPAGTVVATEDPVYAGLRNAFTRAGARLAGVPFGPDGFDPDALGRLIANEQPRLTLVTPNFQNPTGLTMPEEARRAVLESTGRVGSVLVESDIYTMLRYKGQDVPAIKRLDPSGDTILIGSYSKLAFPGLRVGWVIAPREVIARLAESKQWADLHTDQLSQAVLLRFVENGFLEEHRRRVVRAGSERLTAALAACRQHLPRNATYTRPEGGMNLWVRLPEPLDAGELAPRAVREGVSYMPGKHFAVGPPESGALRLSFAGLKPAEIREGIAILGRIFTKEIERVGAESRWDSSPALV